jgi:hypothetical protein
MVFFVTFLRFVKIGSWDLPHRLPPRGALLLPPWNFSGNTGQTCGPAHPASKEQDPPRGPGAVLHGGGDPGAGWRKEVCLSALCRCFPGKAKGPWRARWPGPKTGPRRKGAFGDNTPHGGRRRNVGGDGIVYVPLHHLRGPRRSQRREENKERLTNRTKKRER